MQAASRETECTRARARVALRSCFAAVAGGAGNQRPLHAGGLLVKRSSLRLGPSVFRSAVSPPGKAVPDGWPEAPLTICLYGWEPKSSDFRPGRQEKQDRGASCFGTSEMQAALCIGERLLRMSVAAAYRQGGPFGEPVFWRVPAVASSVFASFGCPEALITTGWPLWKLRWSAGAGSLPRVVHEWRSSPALM